MRIYARGEQIGPYEVRAALPRGGMGVVYVVRPRPGYGGPPLVALKMANKEHNDFLKYEIEHMQQLGHPNVLKALPLATHNNSSPRGRSIYDAKVDPSSSDSPYYIVVEYMRGGSIEQLLKLRGRLSPDEAIEIAIQVAAGLEHIHAHNIVHLDIKDSNILLRQPLSRWRAQQPEIVISDFGIAWSIERKPLDQIYGSQYFTAPERAAGEAPRPHNDIFSLGALLYQLVVGTPPFENTSVPPGTPLEPSLHPSRLNPAVTPALEQVILRALATDPRARYATARQLRDDLERLPRREHPSKIRLPLFSGPRDYALAGAATTALLLLLALILAFTSQPVVSAQPTPVPTVPPSATVVPTAVAPTASPTARMTSTPARSVTSTATLRATSTLVPTATPTEAATATKPVPTARPTDAVQLVVVPDVRGSDVGQARSYLQSLGFQVIVEEEYGGEIPDLCNGRVGYSSPRKGSSVPRGSTIRLHYRSFSQPNNPGC